MKALFASAAVASALLSATVHAQSTVQITGLLDMTAGRFQDAGAQKATRVESGKQTTSFIGFRGTEDLGGGLSAVFALESFLQLDTGGAGRYLGPTTTDAFWSRAANVGLAGDFGTVRLGRQSTPFFFSALLFNAFGSSTQISPSIRQVFTPNRAALPFYGDTGWNNALQWSSKRYGGFAVNLMGNFGESAANSYGNNVGGNIVYFGKPFSATIAYQSVKNGVANAPAGFTSQDSYQVGAAYDLTAVKFFAQYATVKTHAAATTSTKVSTVGLAVPIGRGKVLAQYANADLRYAVAKAQARTLTVGYEYELSKRTVLYAFAMNDRFTAKNNGNTVAAGLRLAF
jgi:predicted porin